MTTPATVQDKIWGQTWPLYSDSKLLVMRLQAVAGGYCSEHFHRYRDNLFVVHQGIMLVRVEMGPNGWEEHRLTAGNSLLVEAGIVHQFEAMTAVLCDEVYYPRPSYDIDLDDIVRRTEGGLR